MKSTLAVLLLCSAFLASGCADMGVMSATVRISNAPPPPAFAFDSDPHFRRLPDGELAVISDDGFAYDMFSFRGSYYLFNAGYWYRSDSPRSGFVAVDARRVPRRILDVDDDQYRWRNHPPGWRGGRHNGDRDHPGDGNDRREGSRGN